MGLRILFEAELMKRFCLTLDLRPDPALIAEYVDYHREGWTEIHASIRDAGVVDMQLYELGGRVFMIMETTDDFSFERKAVMDAENPKVQEWEALMARFQNVDSETDPDAKWRPMRKIFQLQ
jgi:L-rhamnose mutarotase